MRPSGTVDRAGRIRLEQGHKRVRAYLGGELVADTTHPTHSASRGDAQHFTIKAGGKQAEDAAVRYGDSPIEDLRQLIRLDWDAMDGWFEEDEEVYTHPRDPYTRVDILATSRHILVEVDGTVLAESSHAHALFETGLPPRWYIPKVDVRMDLLVPAGTVTVAFLNERVDLVIDGELQQRPVTKFSQQPGSNARQQAD